MRAKILILVAGAAVMFAGSVTQAQSPMPVIVPAANAVATPKPVATTNSSATVQAALKLLQEMKTANEETLKKQAAMLEQLDELEKAADQIKIFSKRG